MKNFLLVLCFIFLFISSVEAQIRVVENDALAFSLSPYLRTDAVTLKNVVSLDSKNKDDSTTYLGIDYSLGLDLKLKQLDSEAFIKFERNGPYDYDAPVAIHNTLVTSAGHMDPYRGRELLPQVEEFWYDFPILKSKLRLKSGLFTYAVGNGVALNGSYENYALSLYHETDNFKWHFYYCRPDLANKDLGPHIKQLKPQGIDYDHSKANFYAMDLDFTLGKNSFQPYVGVLYDATGDKRANNFTTSTHKDMLGTFGLSYSREIEKLLINLEAARNFGKAKSSDEAFKDVEHCGYLFYSQLSYLLDKFVPRTRFVYGSGNKITTEMVDNGDTALTSGKNRAFSVCSPLNVNLNDSIYPDNPFVPVLAMGNGNGLNYGVSRPTTFNDPVLLDNIMLFSLGFDYNFTKKFCMSLDWWYLRSPQRGVGMLAGAAKQLSRDLGNEIDTTFSYFFNDHVSVSLLSAVFFPGKYYEEERDDTDGSLFSPFVRGDGEANNAYQIEASLTLSF
ncbi:MAG: alginate export family protein [Candidatus Omnitrophica bacterium]|nr:alginate export family protein [Candidatus Omnitrophota bacterium]